jgi:hypothetical protein
LLRALRLRQNGAMFNRRFASIIAAAIGMGLCLTSSGAQAFSAADPARILYAGDSIAAETLNTVRWWTQVTRQAVTRDSVHPGMAICDFLDGKPAGIPAQQKLAAQVRSIRPHLVVLQFWGNALLFSPCMGGATPASEDYYTLYFWDALNAAQQINAAAREVGIPKPRILWVLQGPDRDDPNRTRRLNGFYAYAAAQWGDRTSDAGWEVSTAANPYPDASHDRYEWTLFSPCTPFERSNGYCTHPQAFGGVTQLHKDPVHNDPIHFCLGNNTLDGKNCDAMSPGIIRYGMHIAQDANTWLGIAG